MMIRPAKPADAGQIAAFWNPLIRDTTITFSSQQRSELSIAGDISAKADQGLPFIVAEDAGILGFATYAQFRGGDGYRHTMEHTIILAPKAQGRGVARALMQDIEIIAKSNGVRSLMAGISAENVGALGFHQHMGFKIVGTAPQAGRKFDRWIDFILMQKIIGAD